MAEIERALARVDEDHERAVAFLAELVRMPSDNPPGDCAPHAERTKALLQELGFTVETDPVPEELARAYGMVSATNLIVRHRFGDGPTLALNAHGDVVPPGLGWTADPYGAAIRDGWMYGRGVAVSKCDIAAYAFALKALIAAEVPLAGTIELHVTYDEEAGGEIGPARLLAEGLSRPDFAICPGFSHAVVTAHNGCLHLEVEVTGRSAHAAVPESGRDAIAAAVAIIRRIYAYAEGLGDRRSSHPGIDSPTCVVGLISGGINTNVVADRAVFRLDRRIIPEEGPEAVEEELWALIAEASGALEGITAETRRILLARPFLPVAGAERLAAIVAESAGRVLGTPVPLAAVPLYADARHYAAAGIPAVMYGAGPRTLAEANAHRADERLPLETLTIAAKTIVASAAALLAPR
ncbi:MAG TPA: M20/M25/M40 family metallo-hydrolase [Afifellaceae bacterium]|nr:M20/M25/M40 family metallo-hydrolase [Afifellaceae bacterium]